MYVTPEWMSQIELHATLRDFGVECKTRQHEKIINIAIDDTTISALVEIYDRRETSRQITYTRHIERLIRWNTTTGQKKTVDWVDPDYVPEIEILFGRSVTPAEHTAEIAFERDCYRPGSARSPLDNHRRVQAGPTTDAMERYW